MLWMADLGQQQRGSVLGEGCPETDEKASRNEHFSAIEYFSIILGIQGPKKE
jgi:hypothetical protein